MTVKDNRKAFKIDLLMAGLVFLLTLILLFTTSCKHEPRILPSSEDLQTDNTNGTGNGNGNGNNGSNLSTCDPDTVYFENTILPLIVSSCAKSGCHDAVTHKEGIVLDSYQHIVNYGDIRPGDPGRSDLYKVIVSSDPDKVMPPPPAAPLSQADRDLIATWIRQGATNNLCTEGNCDTSIVTYSGSIAPLLQSKCVGCHSNSLASGQVNLAGYNNTNQYVQNGRLMGSVLHSSGYFPMPKGSPQLSDCEIAKLRTWIRDGAQNN